MVEREVRLTRAIPGWPTAPFLLLSGSPYPSPLPPSTALGQIAIPLVKLLLNNGNVNMHLAQVEPIPSFSKCAILLVSVA